MNIELGEHTEYQNRIAEQLRAQQNDLEQSNQKLMEKKVLLAKKNEEIEKIQASLERQTEVLEQTSYYKSEFLENISHKLRTPWSNRIFS